MVGIIIAVVVVLIIIWFIASYNGLVKMRNKHEEAFSTMDVYLKQRFDLVPNLVETVKGYAAHESGTLEKVIAARNLTASAGNMEDKLKAENGLTSTLRSLFAVAENYPDLKANVNFMELQNKLSSLEADIANSRKYYNGVTRSMNDKVQMFPSSIIAGMFGFKKQPMFEVEAEERQNVKVEF